MTNETICTCTEQAMKQLSKDSTELLKELSDTYSIKPIKLFKQYIDTYGYLLTNHLTTVKEHPTRQDQIDMYYIALDIIIDAYTNKDKNQMEMFENE